MISQRLFSMFVLGLFASSIACSSGQDGPGGSIFSGQNLPSREETEAMKTKAPPVTVVKDGRYDPKSFAFEMPLPSRGGDARKAQLTTLESYVQANVTAAQLTESAECLARQYLKVLKTAPKESQPSPRLDDVLSAYCGHVGPAMRQYQFGGKTNGRDFDTLLKDWDGDLKKTLGSIPAGSRVGAAYVQDDTSISFIFVYGEAALTHKPFSLTPTDGVFRFEADIGEAVKSVRAVASQGPLDTVECSFDPNVTLPKMVVTCPLSDQPVTLVQVIYWKPGHLLGSTILDVAVRAPTDAPVVYERYAYLEESAATPKSGDALLPLINSVRATAERPPLAWSAGQANTNAKLAPHLFSAFFNQDSNMAERVSMAVMAGWDAEVPIGRGFFVQFMSFADTARPTRALSWALERPTTRAGLLGGEYDMVAIGVIDEPATPMYGAIVGLYDKIDDGDIEKFKTLALAALDDQRVAANVEKRRGYTEMKGDMARIQAELTKGELKLEDAQQELINVAAKKTQGVQVGTWVYSASDAKAVSWPADWVGQSRMHILTFVHVVRSEGDPWSFLQLVAVGAFPEAAKSAQLSAPTVNRVAGYR